MNNKPKDIPRIVCDTCAHSAYGTQDHAIMDFKDGFEGLVRYKTWLAQLPRQERLRRGLPVPPRTPVKRTQRGLGASVSARTTITPHP